MGHFNTRTKNIFCTFDSSIRSNRNKIDTPYILRQQNRILIVEGSTFVPQNVFFEIFFVSLVFLWDFSWYQNKIDTLYIFVPKTDCKEPWKNGSHRVMSPSVPDSFKYTLLFQRVETKRTLCRLNFFFLSSRRTIDHSMDAIERSPRARERRKFKPVCRGISLSASKLFVSFVKRSTVVHLVRKSWTKIDLKNCPQGIQFLLHKIIKYTRKNTPMFSGSIYFRKILNYVQSCLIFLMFTYCKVVV